MQKSFSDILNNMFRNIHMIPALFIVGIICSISFL